ncbi:GNAT family N-acetyltransferase [Flindersiella endophytica]
MVTLRTERLLIRQFRPGDWEALHETIRQYQTSGLAAYDRPWPTASEEIRKVVEWFATGESYLAVCLQDGTFIGFVSLSPSGPDLHLGYVFNFRHHGQGYATEACRAALAHAFTALGVAQVVTATAELNHASRRLLTRLGLRKTGEQRMAYRTTTAGRPIEFTGYTYVITREEWKSQPGGGS